LPLPEMSSFFEVRLVKETFKFNAAHFIAFRGFRERLHGHNYTCAVRLIGSRRISSDGYLLDFGDVKKVTRSVCKELNEYFLCPMQSVVLTITLVKVDGKEMVKIVCEDGEIFLLPREDCLLLPIVHSSAEEMAIYLWSKILNGLDAPTLIRRGIHTLEVSVSEAIGQTAVFRYPVPTGPDCPPLDVASFIAGENVPVAPCPSLPGKEGGASMELLQIIRSGSSHENGTQIRCCDDCGSGSSWLKQKLQILVDSANEGKMREQILAGKKCSVEDLIEIVGESENAI